MGSSRNLRSFARRLAALHPGWQFLLVDLRCHGASAAAVAPGAHTLSAAADDVLRLLSALKLFPHALIGHSFGGKVAMAMVHQFGRRLPRPVQVWVLVRPRHCVAIPAVAPRTPRRSRRAARPAGHGAGRRVCGRRGPPA